MLAQPALRSARRLRRGLSCGLLALVALRPAAAAEATAGIDGRSFLRGMVVSCPRAGQIWGSPQMARALDRLRQLGVNWIAIHPYAGVRRDGSVRFRPAAESDYLARAVELARAADVRLFWKPHLAYWGSFEWRGAIDFGDDAQAWKRFFEGYRAFIADQARFAEQRGVELLAVGVEYERTMRFESEWRQLIAEVRRAYGGSLTYAANWNGFHRVPFWDALDLIGVHAYFPLALDRSPDRATLERGWDAPLAGLEALSREQNGKPVLFAEIGYSRSPVAAAEPWVPGNRDTPEIRALRRLLIDIALEKIEATSFVQGIFWWKWIPGDDRWDRDFSMKDPEAREALLRRWAPEPTTPATAR